MTTPASEPLVAADAVARTYRRGAEEVRALECVTFKIQRGEFVAMQQSGE